MQFSRSGAIGHVNAVLASQSKTVVCPRFFARFARSGPRGLDRQRSVPLAIDPKMGLLFGMRIIAVSYLRSFWEANPDAEQHLKSWADEVRKANWTQPADIKAHYRNASILKNRRVVFNIKGNDYRLIASVAYRYRAVYVKFIGTHAEYDLIDAETVEQER